MPSSTAATSVLRRGSLRAAAIPMVPASGRIRRRCPPRCPARTARRRIVVSGPALAGGFAQPEARVGRERERGAEGNPQAAERGRVAAQRAFHEACAAIAAVQKPCRMGTLEAETGAPSQPHRWIGFCSRPRRARSAEPRAAPSTQLAAAPRSAVCPRGCRAGRSSGGAPAARVFAPGIRRCSASIAGRCRPVARGYRQPQPGSPARRAPAAHPAAHGVVAAMGAAEESRSPGAPRRRRGSGRSSPAKSSRHRSVSPCCGEERGKRGVAAEAQRCRALGGAQVPLHRATSPARRCADGRFDGAAPRAAESGSLRAIMPRAASRQRRAHLGSNSGWTFCVDRLAGRIRNGASCDSENPFLDRQAGTRSNSTNVRRRNGKPVRDGGGR
jgi:hypothetical protein